MKDKELTIDLHHHPNFIHCRKCKKPMKKPVSKRGTPISTITFKVTGYRCECGHWNELTRRKGYK